ncbi:MAG: preprotein translocase subunit SecG [Planctomycetota bacterium]|nr:preprotein translocase subunit SecG [Planctomycetota bacterium]
MGIFLSVVFFIVAFLMICAVLLQEGKGGGLASMGGAATDSVMGGRNPLRKFTAFCFAIFVIVVVGLNYANNRQANVEINAGLALPAAPAIETLLPADPTLPDPTLPIDALPLDGDAVLPLAQPTTAPSESTETTPSSAAPAEPATPVAPELPDSLADDAPTQE